MLKNNPNHDTLQFLGSWKTSILSPKKQTFSPFLFERRELKQLYWILFSTCWPMFPWSDLVRSLHQMDITLTPESKRSKNFKFMWEFFYFYFFSNSREFSFVGRKKISKGDETWLWWNSINIIIEVILVKKSTSDVKNFSGWNNLWNLTSFEWWNLRL